MKRRHVISIALISVVTFSVRSADASVIILNDVNPGGSAPKALAAFAAAANLWTNKLIDPVTIRLNVSFKTLGSGILASAGSATVGATYSTIRSAITADATSAADAVAVANLPGGSSLQFRTNNVSGTVVLDNNGSANDTVLDVNRANAKALGLLTDDGSTADAQIKFSSAFTFDFDPGNGIMGGAFDFVGIAVHETGHALGFVSGVDEVDYYSGNGPVDLDLNPFRVHSVLDLFRYSSASQALGGPGTLDFATGGTPYFSLNGGTTSLGTFSTGQFNGDGRQASHWKHNPGLEVMDPAAGSGQQLAFTALDLKTFDAMGWDLAFETVVPEPASAALLALGGLGLVAFRRRNRGQAAV